jgi:acyl-CoA thioesterase
MAEIEAVNSIVEQSFAGKTGMKILEFRKGYGKAIIEVKKELYNPNGTLHGGVVFTLCDTLATACCVYSYDLKPVTTTGVYIQFLKAVKDGEIVAEAKVLRMGSRMAVWQVDCFKERELIATAIVEHMILV